WRGQEKRCEEGTEGPAGKPHAASRPLFRGASGLLRERAGFLARELWGGSASPRSPAAFPGRMTQWQKGGGRLPHSGGTAPDSHRLPFFLRGQRPRTPAPIHVGGF